MFPRYLDDSIAEFYFYVIKSPTITLKSRPKYQKITNNSLKDLSKIYKTECISFENLLICYLYSHILSFWNQFFLYCEIYKNIPN